MTLEQTEISARGKMVRVPLFEIGGRQLVLTGGWLKMIAARDEEVVEGEVLEDPESAITTLKSQRPRGDLLTFRQRLPDPTPRWPYHYEWDNWAAIPTNSFAGWWEKLSQDTRRNVRLAAKRGVVLRTVAFDDEYVRGIQAVYDETPMRQGRKFWHYGKDFETVKRENGTYLDRSEHIGAYCGQELIGFIKLIYVGEVATISQILSKNQHYDKRPGNALIAKAVEICEQKAKSHLLYCKYDYGNSEDDPLVEFKRRNGFVKLLTPRYFVPLSLKGQLALRLGLHLGVREVLPRSLVALLLRMRARYQETASKGSAKPAAASTAQAGA